MVCCVALQRPGWAAARSSVPPPTAAAAAARRRTAAWQPEQQRAADAAQAARRRRCSGSGTDGAGAAEAAAAQAELRAHLQERGSGKAAEQLLDSLSAAVTAADNDPAAITGARRRLQAYLQQQDGISETKAAGLAATLSAELGAAADHLVPPALQFFVGHGMRPDEAAQLVAHICESGGHVAFIRHWPKWQPVFEANWQLADSHLTAYQQHCKQTQQRPLLNSKSMATLLSSQPSRYHLLYAPHLASKLAGLQQGQMGFNDAEVGHLIAGGLLLTGREEATVAALEWLVSFGGSVDAAVSMLRGTPLLLNYSTATLDGKFAALESAWAGALQPDQLQQLVQRSPMVLAYCKEGHYAPTADVLRNWFAQPVELYAVLCAAPSLLAASAISLQASERWLTGPPLSLSRQEFLALVQASPQAFTSNLAAPLAQHKLAFLTQVGGVALERALSADHLNYLKYGTKALAGRYFLLAEHGVPLPRHKDGGIVLTYTANGMRYLLQLMRRHDSERRLPTADAEALAYIERWLEAWPETESGRQWHWRKSQRQQNSPAGY